MNFFNLTNVFSWLAANLQILLMCRLKFSLLSNYKPESFTDDTALIC